MQVRTAIILKIKSAATRSLSVVNESLQAAVLDDMLSNARCQARVVHERDDQGPAYLADEDGTFTVELLDPELEKKTMLFINTFGFELAERYDMDWQSPADLARDAAVDKICA